MTMKEEKTPLGLLMDVKKFAVHDGPGIRTTLFLKGCSLRCIWCHNPEGISPRAEMAFYQHKCLSCGECARVCPTGASRMDAGAGHVFERDQCISCGACEAACLGEAMKRFGRSVSVEEALSIALEDRAFYAHSEGGVTVSGGEPLLQAAFVRALFERLKKEDIHTAVDTCGNVPWSAFEAVLPFADMFLFDVKHIDSDAHKALTGAGNERILDNLMRLSASGARIEIRMPLVPGCNDAPDVLDGIGDLLGSLHIETMRVLPYHSMARSKYAALGLKDTMPDVDSPDDEQLAQAVERLHAHGVNAVSGRE